MHKKIFKSLEFIVILVLFTAVGLHEIQTMGKYSRLQFDLIETGQFREQPVSDAMADYIRTIEKPGETLALYWLETDFETMSWNGQFTKKSFQRIKELWRKNEDWNAYCTACQAIWDDLRYFPIPESVNTPKAEVSYVDSWMYERTYGGKRGHEGTDLMASENIRGYYPVVSITDGIVLHKGWLEQGGYRIGITAPGGAYFYYAHLDSYADLNIGDSVKAGDLLGFMGDTGYSKIEGTTGNFPVHLHLGIYLTESGKEISVNPYPILQYLETKKLKCAYERG